MTNRAERSKVQYRSLSGEAGRRLRPDGKARGRLRPDEGVRRRGHAATHFSLNQNVLNESPRWAGRPAPRIEIRCILLGPPGP